MFKKTILAILFFILLLPACSFASEINPSLKDLTLSIDTLCGITLGSQIDAVRPSLQQPPFSLTWNPKYTNTYTFFVHTANKDPKIGYDLYRTLDLSHDLNGTINKVGYHLYFRSKESQYNNLVDALVQQANDRFGVPEEIDSPVGSRLAHHRIWSVDDKHLSVVTYELPGYIPQHPYIIIVAITQS